METKIRWHWAEDDAPWLGVENVFNARTWYGGSALPWPKLGEIEDAPRTWLDGSPPAFPQETEFCGTADNWVSGVPYDQAGSKPQLETGQLTCCIADPPGPGITLTGYAEYTTP